MLLSFITRLYLSYRCVIAFVLLFASKYTKLPKCNYVHVRALPGPPFFSSPSASLPGPLHKRELPSPELHSSPRRLVNISYTHCTKFKDDPPPPPPSSPPPNPPVTHTYAHSTGPLLCLRGIFNFSVMHTLDSLGACVSVCVCHRWYGAGDSALIVAVTKAPPPTPPPRVTFVIALFFIFP